MAIREDVVASAVTFLRDPSVAGSPIENRIAFLQSKNLTQEEVDAALGRAKGDSSPSNYTEYAPPQTIGQPQAGYGAYQQNLWQQPLPPAIPKRDWRDWFIMATVMGGVSYGVYTVAKRYVIPMIAPPTPPQLEQDKKAVDESFDKAFSLLDQLAKDTEELKAAEQARTERLDTALTEVENVIGELKSASKRREEESRRISDEVRGLKDLIPKAMEGQKESTDVRLRELNTELKSLKTLMGQRLNPAPSSTTGTYNRPASTTPAPSTAPSNAMPFKSTTEHTLSPSVGNSSGTEAMASPQARSSSPFGTGAPSGKAAIPSWQMAAHKSTGSVNTVGSSSGPADISSS